MSQTHWQVAEDGDVFEVIKSLGLFDSRIRGLKEVTHRFLEMPRFIIGACLALLDHRCVGCVLGVGVCLGKCRGIVPRPLKCRGLSESSPTCCPCSSFCCRVRERGGWGPRGSKKFAARAALESSVSRHRSARFPLSRCRHSGWRQGCRQECRQGAMSSTLDCLPLPLSVDMPPKCEFSARPSFLSLVPKHAYLQQRGHLQKHFEGCAAASE